MRFFILLGAVFAFGACSPQPATETPAEPAAVTEPTVELATVTTPASGATVTSPLQVSGVAPANWFFENQFPVRLLDANGTEIAMAPATPRINWTEPGPKEYDAELTFTATGPAILVLEEDMPGEGNEPRQVRIPVVLQ
jgi:hypothetical protein